MMVSGQCFRDISYYYGFFFSPVFHKLFVENAVTAEQPGRWGSVAYPTERRSDTWTDEFRFIGNFKANVRAGYETTNVLDTFQERHRSLTLVTLSKR